ncbi:ABC transporter permease [Brevibacterium moorei]|uniref:ABC transporter permease n=1 Tax=Brevibacterium moorei TaxID=2968457 RepID=UPI00211B998A|nr:ABC transporter permease [Brevibacterium sp. 68QC2CO]MCQ9384869.1 ABC transporter permease [Brevibacterium sp. 68QC2CO]
MSVETSTAPHAQTDSAGPAQSTAQAALTERTGVPRGLGRGPQHRGRGLQRRGPLRVGPLRLGAALVIGLALAWAVAPGLFTGWDPLIGTVADRLQPPGPAHWFGTDHLGRDVFARVVHGTARTLSITFIAVLAGGTVGTGLGLIAGTAGHTADTAIMRLIDVLQAIPGLLLSLAIVTALGTGVVPLTAAVAAGTIPSFARITRGEVLRVRGSQFVEAARLDGTGALRTLTTHILPHSVGPVLALAALEFGSAVLTVSALSFLGFGAAPPQPEWGLLVAEGRDYLASAWWMTTLPGLVIAIVVLSVNVLARGASTQNGRAS